MADREGSSSRETPQGADRAPASPVSDPDVLWRLWRRRQSRRVLGHALLLLGCVCLTAFLLWSSMRTWAMLEEHRGGASLTLPASWPMLLIFPVMLLWGMFSSIRGLRRAIVMLKRVPAHDGACCWRCLGVMRQTTASPVRVDCARCGIRVGHDQARTYWEQTHLSPTWAMQWKARHGGRHRGRWRRMMVSFAHSTRRRPRLRHLFIIAMGLVPTTIMCGLVWLLVGRGAAIMLLAISLVVAATGLFLGPGRRTPLAAAGGIERRCARCGHDVALVGDLPERCPECGESFALVGSLRIVSRMERTASRGRTVLVASLFALLIPAGMFLVVLRPEWIMRPLPTGVLISLIGESMLGDGAIEQLLRRPLTADQQRAMIERGLAVRTRDEMSAFDARKALDPFVLAGTMPADLLDRYLLEAAKFTITGPPASDGRTALALSLEVEDHSGSGITPGIGVLFGGWTVDGAPAPGPAGVPGSVIHALLLVDHSYAGNASSQFAPPVTIPQRGDAERALVQARIWLVLMPGAVAAPLVQWNADGTPVLPTGVILAHPVDVERSIRFGTSQEEGVRRAGSDRSPES